MKEESEERKEQSKERTRREKKERVRVEEKCQRKEEEKSRKAGKGAWMVIWEMGRVTCGRGGRPRMNGNTKMAHAR